MRKIFAILSLTVFAASIAIAQTPAATKKAATKITKAAKATDEAPVPRRAGEFVIHMPDGKETLLSAYRGKVVLMAFMHTGCTHCQHTAGVLAKLQTQYAAKGLQVLGVTFDVNAKRDVATFNKTFGVNFPCGYADEAPVLKFMHAPPEYFVPMLAFIDRTGVIREQHIGDNFFADADNNIVKTVDKYLKTPAK